MQPTFDCLNDQHCQLIQLDCNKKNIFKTKAISIMHNHPFWQAIIRGRILNSELSPNSFKKGKSLASSDMAVIHNFLCKLSLSHTLSICVVNRCATFESPSWFIHRTRQVPLWVTNNERNQNRVSSFLWHFLHATLNVVVRWCFLFFFLLRKLRTLVWLYIQIVMEFHRMYSRQNLNQVPFNW